MERQTAEPLPLVATGIGVDVWRATPTGLESVGRLRLGASGATRVCKCRSEARQELRQLRENAPKVLATFATENFSDTSLTRSG